MDPDRFRHLSADALNGIQRGHGILEDHCEFPASVCPHLFF